MAKNKINITASTRDATVANNYLDDLANRVIISMTLLKKAQIKKINKPPRMKLKIQWSRTLPSVCLGGQIKCPFQLVMACRKSLDKLSLMTNIALIVSGLFTVLEADISRAICIKCSANIHEEGKKTEGYSTPQMLSATETFTLVQRRFQSLQKHPCCLRVSHKETPRARSHCRCIWKVQTFRRRSPEVKNDYIKEMDICPPSFMVFVSEQSTPVCTVLDAGLSCVLTVFIYFLLCSFSACSTC